MNAHNLKRALLILACLFLSWPALSSTNPAMQEIEALIRVRDYSQAVSRLRSLANQGDSEAQYRLAGLYRAGKGVSRDLDKATELYRKSAIAGNADAQFSLAQLVSKSGNSPALRSEARKWYRKSAAQGHELAALKLEQPTAKRKATGKGVSEDEIFNAIRHNDEDLINSLISNGVDLNLSDRHGNTTIMTALLAGWPQLAGTLIDNTTIYAQPNSLGTRPLQLASARGYRNIVIALLVKNVNINQTDSRGDSALIMAVRNKHTEIARLLLDHGAKHDLINKKKKSAVDLAYADDNPDSRALFASYGIKPRAVVSAKVSLTLDEFRATVKKQGARYAGWPLLNIAIELGESSVSKQIIERRPALGATDPDGNSALHVAARKGDAVVLGRLVSLGANLNATNLRNETALYLATESACLKCVQRLLDKGADPSIATKFEITPLEIAVQKKQPKIALLLLNSSTSYAGIHRVLLLAVQKKLEGLSRALIKRDSRLASLDEKRRSVLWHSADQGLAKTTAGLIDSGKIDINGKDVNGYSALAQASLKGHVKVARLLIDRGADVNTQTDAGNTLLMQAVLAKDAELVEFLLTRSIDINTQNGLGETALMLAARSGQRSVIESLINAGADMQLRNKEDLNAFQIATNAGHTDVAKLIYDKSNFVFQLFN
ncbi:MAG: ankyrin repeat domain-containing protein [Gammaproteobacteria bacterium]|nr:ankyrin repeat domain-containing protein [Gammaproteobacteria bacterium]